MDYHEMFNALKVREGVDPRFLCAKCGSDVLSTGSGFVFGFGKVVSCAHCWGGEDSVEAALKDRAGE